ncbi:MAG: hypothetical protein IPH45_07520 [Bacteroidales bacterium]|nr:hypothetical protein [Bacteroidales bacterium]
MKNLTPKILLLAFIGLIMLASCEYNYYVIPPEPEAPIDTTGNTDTTNNDTTIVTVDTISFSQDLLPFFSNKCEICHKGSTPPDLRPSKAYASLMNGFVVAKDIDNSVLYQSCKPGGSMKSYCSSAELKLIQRWILKGAKND